jgi:hypothetical protein
MKVHLHHILKIKSQKEVTKQKELRFFLLFCLMIEGSGSGSIPLTNGSESGRPKKCGSAGSGTLPSTVPYRQSLQRTLRICQDFSLGLRLIRNQFEISEGLNYGFGYGCVTRSPCIPQSFGMQNLDLLKMIKSIHKNYDDFTNLFQVSGSILTSNNRGSASLVDPVDPSPSRCIINFFFLFLGSFWIFRL